MALDKLLGPRRLMAVDLARGVALVGMMATHVVPSLDADGSVSRAYEVAGGRASALFAVLAGLSLVLSTRSSAQRAGTGTGPAPGLVTGARRGVLARAGVILVVGLTLGSLPSGVAVILVNYAVLFAVGALFLGLPNRVLAPLAVAWLVLSPVVAHLLRDALVRGGLPPGPGPVTSWMTLTDPVELVTTLLLTGYYPVLQWTGYLLVGMVVARLPLRDPVVGGWLLATGTVTAAVAKVVSVLLVAAGGGLQRLTVPPDSVLAGRDVAVALRTGTYGTTPTTTWWWLAVAGPHTGTPFDLLHTTGTALAVLGACVLLVALLRRTGRLVLVPLAAAGSMTFTLYTLHVVVLTATGGAESSPAQWSPTGWWTVHVLGALALGTLWALTPWKGPLEALASEASSAARGAASAPSSRPD